MSILENQKFALMVCEMFYNQDMTQKEIAAALNVSRPQVCRILAHAKSSGLVSIHLNYPNTEESLYECKLRELYGISEVYVYDIGSDDQPAALDLLAQKASGLFASYLKDNSRIGVMAGRTISALAKALPAMKSHGLEFVPLCGSNNSNGCEWFANATARLFAEKTGGKYYLLNAPATLSSIEAKQILENEDSIRKIIDLWKECNAVLLGIGAVGTASSTSLAGSLHDEEVKSLRASGAMASICCSYLNKSGKEICTPLTERFIGASINQFNNAKKIAIAIGHDKVSAIHTALISDNVNVLITSLETAKQLAEK